MWRNLWKEMVVRNYEFKSNGEFTDDLMERREATKEKMMLLLAVVYNIHIG